MDLALAELQRPAGVRILLRRWGGFVWPDLVRLDCILFSFGVALFGCRCQRCVDDLAALAQLTVEIGEQYFQRDGLGQLLAKQPDRAPGQQEKRRKQHHSAKKSTSAAPKPASLTQNRSEHQVDGSAQLFGSCQVFALPRHEKNQKATHEK